MQRRASTATVLAGSGIVLLIVASFLPWYRFAGLGAGGAAIGQVARAEHLATAANFWKAWGAMPDALFAGLLAALIAAASASVLAPEERAPAALALGVAVALLGLVLAWVLHLPGPDELVRRAVGGWLAVGGAAACVVGAFLAVEASRPAPAIDPPDE